MNEGLPTDNRFTMFRRYYRSLQPILEKPKTRMYTSVVFSFLAISLFAFYAIKPTIQTIISLRREITDMSEINRRMEQKLANLIEAQAAYQAAQDQLPLIEEAVPTNPDAVDVTLQLRNLIASTTATSSSTRLGDVPLLSSEVPKEPGKQNKIKTVDYAVNTQLSGPYDSMESVLTAINLMRRLITVDSISLTPNQDLSRFRSNQSNLLKANLQLKSYYSP